MWELKPEYRHYSTSTWWKTRWSINYPMDCFAARKVLSWSGTSIVWHTKSDMYSHLLISLLIYLSIWLKTIIIILLLPIYLPTYLQYLPVYLYSSNQLQCACVANFSLKFLMSFPMLREERAGGWIYKETELVHTLIICNTLVLFNMTPRIIIIVNTTYATPYLWEFEHTLYWEIKVIGICRLLWFHMTLYLQSALKAKIPTLVEDYRGCIQVKHLYSFLWQIRPSQRDSLLTIQFTLSTFFINPFTAVHHGPHKK